MKVCTRRENRRPPKYPRGKLRRNKTGTAFFRNSATNPRRYAGIVTRYVRRYTAFRNSTSFVDHETPRVDAPSRRVSTAAAADPTLGRTERAQCPRTERTHDR